MAVAHAYTTGRARHSDRGAPQFRGGGKAHGKRPRRQAFVAETDINARRHGVAASHEPLATSALVLN